MGLTFNNTGLYYMQKEVILKHDMLRIFGKELEGIDTQRVVNSCLSSVYQRVLFEGKEYVKADIERYAARGGLSIGKAYTEFKDIIEKLTKTVERTLPDGKVWATRLIYEYIYDDIDKTISVRFNNEMLQYISGDMPKGTFALYDGRFDSVKSNKRYLMTELLQRNMYRFDKNERVVIPLNELRYYLNLAPTEYIEFSALAVRVIIPALKDIAELMGVYIIVQKRTVGAIFTVTTQDNFDAKYNRKK